MITEKFHPPDVDSFTVYFTDQFFQGLGQDSGYPSRFAGYVKDAAVESWQKQVVDWHLADGLPSNKPKDADAHHQFFAINTLNWYHGEKCPSQNSGAWSYMGGNIRKVWVRCDAWHRFEIYYSSLALLLNSMICHEFYHGIQGGHSRIDLKVGWKWFIEGQARFLQSVQVQNEEFLHVNHQYPEAANGYLDSLMNRSLKSLDYPFCLYWRFLYEKFNKDGSTKDKLEIIRDAYKSTDTVGNHPIVDGSRAISRAFSNSPQVCKPCTTFAQSIDSFATTCYLRDFKPDSIYVKPFVEARCLLLPLPDSFLNPNRILNSFGIDYFEFISSSELGKSCVWNVDFSFAPGDTRVKYSRKFIVYERNNPNFPKIKKFDRDTTLDFKEIDSLAVCITRLDVNEDSLYDTTHYTLKAKLNINRSDDSIPHPPTKEGDKDDDIPVYTKPQGEELIIEPIIVKCTNIDGKDDSLDVRVKVETVNNSFYYESTKVFLRLGESKNVGNFPKLRITETGLFKMTSYLNSAYDIDRSNDTVIGYFRVVDDSSPNDPPFKFSLLYEEFDEWPVKNWKSRHWSPKASCWHLRKAGEWPWGSLYRGNYYDPPPKNDTNSSNYMCLRWHGRGHCYETLYTPNIVCSNYDSVKLRFRVLFWQRPAMQCTARLVYSTNGGQTWPFVLVDRYLSNCNGYQEYTLDSAAHKSRIKIAWTYAGDSTDIVAWCIDDVKVRGYPITALDVAPREISWPFDRIVPADSQCIWFNIRNLGATDADNVKTLAWIGNNRDSVIISKLPVFTDTFIKIKVPVPNEGNHQMKVITQWNHDCCILNDTIIDDIVVVDSFWESVCQYPLGKTKGYACFALTDSTDSLYFWGGRNVLLFYQYFPRSNQWDTLARLLLKINKGFLVWTGDSIIYLITKRKKPLCRYWINSNHWDTTLGRITKKIRNPAACWDGGNYIFCIRGSGANEIYRYSLADSDWVSQPIHIDYGYRIKRRGGITCHGQYIYVMGIKNHTEKLMRYDTIAKDWDTLKGLPFSLPEDKVRELFYADNRIYVLRDNGKSGIGEMWYYDIDDGDWYLASPGTPQWVSNSKIKTGACLSIWKDEGTHYGFIFTGRKSRLLKFYPKPIPYFDEYAGPEIVKTMTRNQDILSATYETEHFLPKFSPTSDSIICFYEDTTEDYYRLSKMDLLGNEDQMVIDDANYERPSYTPDGTWIIAVKDNIVTKISKDGSQEEALSTGFCDEPVVAPLGGNVVYTKLEDGHHRLYRVPLNGSAAETPLTEPGYSCNSPQFSSEGNKIVYEKYVNGHSHIYTYSFETQEENEIMGGDHYHYFNPRFSPDGNWVVYERKDNDECSQICRASTVIDSFELLTSSD
ncbi:MAG: hypothetical protein OEW70_05340, partial [candidate division WOR-3 bacterium]|nr:hypothetical protein [candidate division WOR-3 bacterium]